MADLAPLHFPLPNTGLAARARAVQSDTLEKLREDVRRWDADDLLAFLVHAGSCADFVARAHGLDPDNMPPDRAEDVLQWTGALTIAICDELNRRIPPRSLPAGEATTEPAQLEVGVDARKEIQGRMFVHPHDPMRTVFEVFEAMIDGLWDAIAWSTRFGAGYMRSATHYRYAIYSRALAALDGRR